MLLKRAGLFVVSLMFVISLVACGTSNSQTDGTVDETELSSPLELDGLWKQENAGESYMVAAIQDDRIGVFFMIEGNDEPLVYWYGTYSSPTDNKDVYSWTSESTYEGTGMFVSSDSTKEFRYKNGKLTYRVTVDGETADVTLVRGEWDTSAFTSGAAKNKEALPLEIKDYEWGVKDGKWFKYCVTLYNPNDNIAIEYPSFRITARDDNGVILGTDDQVGSIIYPKQEYVYGGQAFSVDAIPAKVEFEALAANEYNLKRGISADAYIPLETANTAARSGKIVGEIHNKNNYDIDHVIVVVILRNEAGETVDIGSTYVNNIKASEVTPFSVSTFVNFASYEVYAN